MNIPNNYAAINPAWENIMKASEMSDDEIHRVIKQALLWQTKDFSDANREEGAPWIMREIFGKEGVSLMQKMALNFIYSELVAAGIIKEGK